MQSLIRAVVSAAVLYKYSKISPPHPPLPLTHQKQGYFLIFSSIFGYSLDQTLFLLLPPPLSDRAPLGVCARFEIHAPMGKTWMTNFCMMACATTLLAISLDLWNIRFMYELETWKSEEWNLILRKCSNAFLKVASLVPPNQWNVEEKFSCGLVVLYFLCRKIFFLIKKLEKKKSEEKSLVRVSSIAWFDIVK